VAAAGGPPRTGAGPASLVITARAMQRAAAAVPGGPAVTRQQGERLARAELSKEMYHHTIPLPERIEEAIARLLNGAAVTTDFMGLIALAALLVIVVVVVLAWIGPVARSRSRGHTPLLAPSQLSAREHRQQAESMAAAGDYTAAIIESVRAIAVDLEERDILPPRVGRTADEFAAEASQPLPDHAAGLAAVARLFDDVRYGERAGTAAGYRRVRDTDAAIQAARPVAAAGPRAAVPALAGPVS
jgi:Domain of unknown function (DUF4129)